MLKATRFGAAILVAVLVSTCAHAAERSVTRAYLMNGLFGEFVAPTAMPSMAAKLRARGAIVTVGSWTMAAVFGAMACAHPHDRIVFIGHSLGGPAAARAAGTARACGVRSVSVVSIDPPRNGVAVPKGVRSTNFVGVLGGQIGGGRNVPTGGYGGHLAIVNDPHMQARVVGAALSH